MENECEQHRPYHLEEYKATHEEIIMCQREMHRTWLWATIAAGAIYTWLASHGSEIDYIGSDWLIWIIPPILLFFCFLRYLIFRNRIGWLTDYLLRIEDWAFKQENGLPGLAHHHRERFKEKVLSKAPKRVLSWARNRVPSWATVLTYGGTCFWLVLIVWAGAASYSLSLTKSEHMLFGKVADSHTGQPIGGATVTITNRSNIAHTVTTDAAGHFRCVATN
jgi:hypothetical protein